MGLLFLPECNDYHEIQYYLDGSKFIDIYINVLLEHIVPRELNIMCPMYPINFFPIHIRALQASIRVAKLNY